MGENNNENFRTQVTVPGDDWLWNETRFFVDGSLMSTCGCGETSEVWKCGEEEKAPAANYVRFRILLDSVY